MSQGFIKSSKKYWKIFGILYLLMILFFVALNFGLFGKMPSIKELENPKNHLASEIFDAKGGFMGKIYTHNEGDSQLQEATFNTNHPGHMNGLIKGIASCEECLVAYTHSIAYAYDGDIWHEIIERPFQS